MTTEQSTHLNSASASESEPAQLSTPVEGETQQPGTQGSFWGAMFGAVSGAVGVVGSATAQAAGAVGGAVASAGETVAGTAAGAAGAVGNATVQAAGAIGGAASYTGGAIAGTAVGIAGVVGGAAMQATDGVGYVLDLITNSPQLQALTKALKVDWLLTIVDRVDIVQAETHVRNLQKKYPNEKPGDIAHRIMIEKTLLVGGSGFASSLMPGFAATMFVVDLAATMALQAEMVYQIAGAYGLKLQEPARKGEVLAIFGMALGGNSALKAGLGFARNVPVAGAVIGASSNAAMLYALGFAACRFYETKFSPSANLLDSQAESEKYLQGLLDQQVVMDQILIHLVMAGQPRKKLQQLLPEIQTLNLNPASMAAITAAPKSLPPLEKLLDQLNEDFAVSLIAQCQSIAESDGVITHQESQAISMIKARFSHLLPSSEG